MHIVLKYIMWRIIKSGSVVVNIKVRCKQDAMVALVCSSYAATFGVRTLYLAYSLCVEILCCM